MELTRQIENKILHIAPESVGNMSKVAPSSPADNIDLMLALYFNEMFTTMNHICNNPLFAHVLQHRRHRANRCLCAFGEAPP